MATLWYPQAVWCIFTCVSGLYHHIQQDKLETNIEGEEREVQKDLKEICGREVIWLAVDGPSTAFLMESSRVSRISGSSCTVASLKLTGDEVANESNCATALECALDGGLWEGRSKSVTVGKMMLRTRVTIFAVSGRK